VNDVDARRRVVQFHQFLPRAHRNRQDFGETIRDPRRIVEEEGFGERKILRIAFLDRLNDAFQHFRACAELRECLDALKRRIVADQFRHSHDQIARLDAMRKQPEPLRSAGLYEEQAESVDIAFVDFGQAADAFRH
jgi:hypothetical protein